MNKANFIILDIKYKLKSELKTIINGADSILTLTPYSYYIAKQMNSNVCIFHDLISVSDFKDEIYSIYIKLTKNKIYKNYFFILNKIMALKVYEEYIKTIDDFCKIKKETHNIIYITDTNSGEISYEGILNNKVSMIKKLSYINKIYYLNNHKSFYILNQLIYNTTRLIKIKFKIINRLLRRQTISYDAKYFMNSMHQVYKNKVPNSYNREFKLFCNETLSILLDENCAIDFDKLYIDLINNCIEEFLNYNPSELTNQPFTFLSNITQAKKALLLKNNNALVVFFQHGGYLYGGEYTLWNEIIPSSVNFTLNCYTKNMMYNLGADKVYTIGSRAFNYKIKNRNKVYDFLYIILCTHYSGYGLYNDLVSRDSLDGNEIFRRHKLIIELFGTKFKDKQICIKIQPGIFTGTMLYVPFLELSKMFKNITIEFSVPISKLIEQSKYIISDYFSSEFINRDLHYQRDIIMFQGSPLPLPEETVEDMKKMFILVDTVDDLEKKIENIEEITKNRMRYDDIIEYYSSKKCDTKKLVTEILEKEFDGR